MTVGDLIDTLLTLNPNAQLRIDGADAAIITEINDGWNGHPPYRHVYHYEINKKKEPPE
jgi:hypothetical protein